MNSGWRKMFLPCDFFGGRGFWECHFMYFASCLWKYLLSLVVVMVVVVVSLFLSLSLPFLLFFFFFLSFFLVAGLHRTNLRHNWHGHVRRASPPTLRDLSLVSEPHCPPAGLSFRSAPKANFVLKSMHVLTVWQQTRSAFATSKAVHSSN